MQSSQTAQKDQTLATATLFWPLRSGQWPEVDAPWPELSAQLYLRSVQFPVTRILIKVFATARLNNFYEQNWRRSG